MGGGGSRTHLEVGGGEPPGGEKCGNHLEVRWETNLKWEVPNATNGVMANITEGKK